MGPGRVETKKSKRDENDILGFDFKIEWACGVGAESDLNE
jgi:hypothetical protein